MTPKAKRPPALQGRTIELFTHCGNIYITVNLDPATGKPLEVFCRFGKAGGCGSAIMDGMTRVISYGLRSGLEAADVVAALSGITCLYGKATCMDAVARGIGMVMGDDETA
jgi:hypothetical protein